MSTYVWQVVYDPERMYTGPFRALDLKETAKAGYWPEGIIFEHKRTGEQLVFLDGQLLEVPQPEAAHGTLH
jgi:hypothetical protein